MDSPILIYGAGAIGCTVYRWLQPFYDNLVLLARGNTAERIRSMGISIFKDNAQKLDTISKIHLIESVDELIEEPEIIIITVKNYSLEGVCQSIKNKFPSNKSLIVALQNGVENLEIIPKYFPRIIYGVICYNAWREKQPNIIGYKDKGPIILGTLDNTLQEDLKHIESVFNKGFLCEITSHYADAAHNKILLNLTNAFFTLIGLGFQEIPSLPKFRKLTTSIMSEGLKVLNKAGFKEVKLGSFPSWLLLRLASTLPGFITNFIFKNTLKKTTGVNSMAQDLLINRSNNTELESLNGYFIQLAKKNGYDAKVNQKLYEICKREFSKENFQPLSIDLVWDEFRDVL